MGHRVHPFDLYALAKTYWNWLDQIFVSSTSMKGITTSSKDAPP
jgi:hypothetical protein